MKLLKALKKKNNIVSEINILKEKINKFNYYIEDDFPKVNIKEKKERLVALKDDLIKLKTAIAKANVENNLQKLIYEIAELKDSLVFWKDVEIREGIETSTRFFGSSEKSSKFKSVVGERERESIISALQHRIEDIQDKLDEYNATIEIDVDID